MKSKLWIASTVVLFTFNCAVRDHGLFLKPVPEPSPMRVTIPHGKQIYSNGSIFSKANVSASMISDTKAYRVNDIVIVHISESTSAKNSANTSTDKKTERDLGVPSLFGLETSSFPKLNSNISASSLVSTSTKANHAGKGSTERSGQFQGTVAARVLQVLPNGYLMVQGYKNVQVNGEQGNIYLTGLVNPLLISKNHTISSNQIADLELFYGGKGLVGGTQNPGWLTRLIDVVWPF
ncbi:MAG: hypothetical protein CSA81_01445 [Acidobacteria bacterium]|nr:MAG: hypothetical protein CSA81_01445 [Acidobacteriota bacterium]PIE89015.1 MAG: hypothetical protein CR997_13535 [Acidobacteriota bacterium]